MRVWSYVLMAVVAVGALGFGVVSGRDDRSVEDRVAAVASTIRCPQCRSQPAQDSDVSAARAVRDEIARQVEAGATDDEIRDYFAERYGEEILLRPPAGGVGALVWIVPVVALVVGGAGLALAFRRWRTWT